jgi:hypothetical protein
MQYVLPAVRGSLRGLLRGLGRIKEARKGRYLNIWFNTSNEYITSESRNKEGWRTQWVSNSSVLVNPLGGQEVVGAGAVDEAIGLWVEHHGNIDYSSLLLGRFIGYNSLWPYLGGGRGHFDDLVAVFDLMEAFPAQWTRIFILDYGGVYFRPFLDTAYAKLMDTSVEVALD